jgi:uncharacterized protein YciI
VVRDETEPSAVRAKVAAHVKWLKGLIDTGVIRQAGKWGETGGMAIIVANDEAEAHAIQRRDPFVVAELVHYELAPFRPDVELG